MKGEMVKKLYTCDLQLEDVYQCCLCNENGVLVYGLKITDFIFPDHNGDLDSVVLGFLDFSLLREKTAFVNAIIDRYASRVNDSNFNLRDRKFISSCNEYSHNFHNNASDFYKRNWQVENFYKENELYLICSYLISVDAGVGCQGVLDCSVGIILDDNKMAFKESGSAANINITSFFFSLSDEGFSVIGDHIFMTSCAEDVKIVSSKIPSASVIPIDGAPLGFSQPKAICNALVYTDKKIERVRGIDHCYVSKSYSDLNFMRISEAGCPSTGLKIKVFSTQSVVSGFCVELQHIQDTPNQAVCCLLYCFLVKSMCSFSVVKLIFHTKFSVSLDLYGTSVSPLLQSLRYLVLVDILLVMISVHLLVAKAR